MTVTITAGQSEFAPPGVLIDVASSPSVTAPLTVYRVHEDGTRHKVLAGRSVLIGSWTGIDRHCPFNQTVHYVAAAEDQPESSLSGDVYQTESTPWMIHPSRPELSFPIRKIRGPQQPVTYSSRAAAFDVLPDPSDDAESLPVIRNDYTRSGASGKLTIEIGREDELSARAFFRSGGPVLINGVWGQTDVPWMWIVAKDIVVSNPGGFIDFPTRNIDFDFRACRAPDADVTPLNTYANVKSKGGYTTVKTLYDGYRAMKLGIETP